MSEKNFPRLLRLLQLIPARTAGIDTTQLMTLLSADDLAATPRTLQRDLLKLEGMGFGVECIDSSKPYRWRLSAAAPSFTVPGVDVPQALALRLMEEHLKALVPRAAWAALRPHLEAARRVLQDKPARRWLDRVRVLPRAQPLLPPNIDVSVLDTLHVALLERQEIQVRYQKGKGDDDKDMTLHPLGLVYRDALAYVVATAFDYDDVRLYAVHRMRTVVASGNAARRAPDGFDLDEFIARGELSWRLGTEPVSVELAFYDGAERAVLESPLTKEQVVRREDKRVVVSVVIPDTRVLRAWLLGFGASVEVLKPRALRQAVAGAQREALARYAPTKAKAVKSKR